MSPTKPGHNLGHHSNFGVSTGRPANTLSPEEAAWLAALIDGEGSIMFVKSHWNLVDGRKRTGRRLRIAIANTHKPLLDKVLEVAGCGTIARHGDGPQSKFRCYSWTCSSANALSLLRQAAPWLIVKREKLLEAERFFANRGIDSVFREEEQASP